MEQKNNKEFNLVSLRRNYKEPHKHYHTLRQYDPIYFDQTSQCWLVTSHAAVSKILGDMRFTSRLSEDSISPITSVNKQMLFKDGDEHKRAQDAMLRPLASMTKTVSANLRVFAQELLKEKQLSGEFDLVSDFSGLITLFAISLILGVPTDDVNKLTQLGRWSDTFGDLVSGYFSGNLEDVANLEAYFLELILARRKHPDDDLLSALIAAEDAFLDEDDLVANCMMIFAAGRLTAKKALGNGIPLIMQDWEQTQKDYQNDPKGFPKLLTEEMLRIVTPTRYLMRQALEDIDLSADFPGNHVIRRGERALLFLEAANRDPAIFDLPDTFNPSRRPNRHLAFGFGRHMCLGAALARLEIQIALEVLLSLSDLHLKPDTSPAWNPNPNLGGYTSCPVHFRF